MPLYKWYQINNYKGLLKSQSYELSVEDFPAYTEYLHGGANDIDLVRHIESALSPVNAEAQEKRHAEEKETKKEEEPQGKHGEEAPPKIEQPIMAETSQREAALRTLGLRLDAGEKAIKQAYRRLSLIWHPDKCSSSASWKETKCKEEFQKLSSAYSKLQEGNEADYQPAT